MPVYCSLHHENPDGSAFCDECGEPLAIAAPAASAPAVSVASAPAPAPTPAAGGVACPSCGSINAPGEAFCSNCGVSLMGAPSAQAAPASPVAAVAPDATAVPASVAAPVAAPA